MLAAEFLRTIYLDDRACKSITIDGWKHRVVIRVDEISRVRSETGNWEFYNDENIVDGLLVFSDVRSVLFDPAGPIPNDYISAFFVTNPRNFRSNRGSTSHTIDPSRSAWSLDCR